MENDYGRMGRDELIIQLKAANAAVSHLSEQGEIMRNQLDAATIVLEKSWLAWQAARTAHEANRAYCKFLGDDSQQPWWGAPQWQKDSAQDGVWAIIHNREITPEESHGKWMKAKSDEGWVYGEVKDPVAKTHPCMVPYEDLPKEQQFKDALFGAVVRGVLDTQLGDP